MDVVFLFCIVTRGAVGTRVYMGSMSVSSCKCCMFVSCVHHVAVLNVAFCMTCSLLLQEATIWKRHTPEPVS